MNKGLPGRRREDVQESTECDGLNGSRVSSCLYYNHDKKENCSMKATCHRVDSSSTLFMWPLPQTDNIREARLTQTVRDHRLGQVSWKLMPPPVHKAHVRKQRARNPGMPTKAGIEARHLIADLDS